MSATVNITDPRKTHPVINTDKWLCAMMNIRHPCNLYKQNEKNSLKLLAIYTYMLIYMHTIGTTWSPQWKNVHFKFHCCPHMLGFMFQPTSINNQVRSYALIPALIFFHLSLNNSIVIHVTSDIIGFPANGL